jgi:hypothetical protein
MLTPISELSSDMRLGNFQDLMPAFYQRNGAPHPHHAARLGADLGDHLLGGFRFDQCGKAAVVELAADLRDREAAGRSVLSLPIFPSRSHQPQNLQDARP